MKNDYTYNRRDEGLPLGVTGTRLSLIRRVQFETWRATACRFVPVPKRIWGNRCSAPSEFAYRRSHPNAID
jgi:hypothetical protein